MEKLRRHNRQGSFKTRERYYEAMKRFCRFLAEQYRLERLANIAPKHIFAYVYCLQEGGKAASTIKTELSAIRFFHDLIPNPRFELPDNSQLLLQRRTPGGVDRTWSIPEFNRMLACALSAERDDYITILYLGRYAALRIHECFRIDTAIAAKALKENVLTIKGKGGLVRTVPLTASMAEYLRGIQKRQQKEKAFLGASYVDSGYVCVGPDGTPLTPNTVSMHFRRMIRKSGLPYIRFHGLRHSVATLLHSVGRDIQDIQGWLGHSDISTPAKTR